MFTPRSAIIAIAAVSLALVGCGPTASAEAAAGAPAEPICISGIYPPLAVFIEDKLAELAKRFGDKKFDIRLISQGIFGAWIRIGFYFALSDQEDLDSYATTMTNLALGTIMQFLPGLAWDARLSV